MSAIATSQPVAEWLLHEAEHNPARAFTDYPPHACKLCDDPTPPAAWRRHLREHRNELRNAARDRRRELERERNRRLRELNARRRENRDNERRTAAHATT